MSCTAEKFYVSGVACVAARIPKYKGRTNVKIYPGAVPAGEQDSAVSAHQLVEQGWAGPVLVDCPAYPNGIPLFFGPDTAYGQKGRRQLEESVTIDPLVILAVPVDRLKDDDSSGYSAKVAGHLLDAAVLAQAHKDDGTTFDRARNVTAMTLFDAGALVPRSTAAVLSERLAHRPRGQQLEMLDLIADTVSVMAIAQPEAAASVIAPTLADDFTFTKLARSLPNIAYRAPQAARPIIEEYLFRGIRAGEDTHTAAWVAAAASELISHDPIGHRHLIPQLLSLSAQVTNSEHRLAIAGAAATGLANLVAAGGTLDADSLTVAFA